MGEAEEDDAFDTVMLSKFSDTLPLVRNNYVLE